ncbi:MAG: glycerol-3-phosphate 1-O-acyltransferase PlsY [Caldilineales bacterium]|nr:glycerol-3-phosphate 1-O-acyltransferase PlsY [Caldilineales bacterium]
MPWINYILAALIGYLLGSIPVGYLIARAKGVDIRTVGSGRTGGTNMYRAFGFRWALASGLLDVLKGFLAVMIARQLFGDEIAAALAGAAAVSGHNWSIFLHFKGGAGAATGVGALIALNPMAAAITIPFFVAILLIVRYASVATLSVAGIATVTLAALYLLGASPGAHIVFGLIVCVLIVWALRPNLVRLWTGTERRIEFRKPA